MLAPLLAFWRPFAEVQGPVAGGSGLSSRPAPLDFANGVWEPDPNRMTDAADWCVAEGLPPAAIVDAAHPLAVERGAERLLIAVGVAPGGDESGDPLRLEQVGWNHTRPLVELIAYRYDRMDVLEELSRTVAGALEQGAGMEAYLAYDAGGEFAGGALALPVGEGLVVLWAEGRAELDPAAAVAGRFPGREAWRMVSVGLGDGEVEGALVAAARVTLDG